MSGSLVFQGVAKTFADGTRALRPTDLAVQRGELVALVGPSGCGKSTLLRIAAGLEDPSEGMARCDGTIGYVFQDATLLPWRSVRRNVELGAELDGVGVRQRRERAQQALELVGLEDFAGHMPATLSGGMRMRVSLARALVLEPDVFLFDEPFGALDEITRERLNEELGGLFALQPFAGLFVTHNVYEAVFCATRVLVLSERPGKVVFEVDVPFEFPRKPELRFTSQYGELVAQVSRALRSTAVPTAEAA